MNTWTKTVVGLLKSSEEAQFAINDLINCGVPGDAITLRTGDVEHHVWSQEEETDIKMGNMKEGELGGADFGSMGSAHPAKIRVGRGDVTALISLGLPQADARYYSQGVDRGGYLLTVVVGNDRAEEAAEIIRRHGAIEDENGASWRGAGWTAAAAAHSSPLRPWASREEVPLSHATLSEQLERAEVFKAQEGFDLRAKNEQQSVGQDVSLPSADIFEEHDIRQFDVKQRELQDGRDSRTPEVGAEIEAASAGSGPQPVDVSAMDDEEFQRHFRATYGERGERFDEPYRSAYYFAEAESSSHPQFAGKEWYEVEQEIHRDWEISHPGTWNKVENAIHFGWDTTRRHH